MSSLLTKAIISPNWASTIKATSFTTTKLNQWDFGKTNPQRQADLKALTQDHQLPTYPHFLSQIHSNKVVTDIQPNTCQADGWFTTKTNIALGILTADCLPVVLVSNTDQQLAVLHAGWRGLAGGIIPQAMTFFSHTNLSAWLGPAISYPVFEVGEDIVEIFSETLKCQLTQYNLAKSHPQHANKWLLSLKGIAVYQLGQLGIKPDNIFQSEHCTYSEPELFYSHRRQQEKGRMATIAWLHD